MIHFWQKIIRHTNGQKFYPISILKRRWRLFGWTEWRQEWSDTDVERVVWRFINTTSHKQKRTYFSLISNTPRRSSFVLHTTSCDFLVVCFISDCAMRTADFLAAFLSQFLACIVRTIEKWAAEFEKVLFRFWQRRNLYQKVNVLILALLRII